jgi:hypothetical protein
MKTTDPTHPKPPTPLSRIIITADGNVIVTDWWEALDPLLMALDPDCLSEKLQGEK